MSGAGPTLEKVTGPSCCGSPAMMTAVPGLRARRGAEPGLHELGGLVDDDVREVVFGHARVDELRAERVVLTTTTMRNARFARAGEG